MFFNSRRRYYRRKEFLGARVKSSEKPNKKKKIKHTHTHTPKRHKFLLLYNKIKTKQNLKDGHGSDIDELSAGLNHP
jgi:hypothetical protein